MAAGVDVIFAQGAEAGGHLACPNAPHRTLRTPFVQQWLGQEARGQESRPDEPPVGQTIIGGQPMPVLQFMGFPPNRDASGDIESGQPGRR